MLGSPTRLNNSLNQTSSARTKVEMKACFLVVGVFFVCFFFYRSNDRLATFKKYINKRIFQGNLEQILPFALEEMLTSKSLLQFSEMLEIAF